MRRILFFFVATLLGITALSAVRVHGDRCPLQTFLHGDAPPAPTVVIHEDHGVVECTSADGHQIIVTDSWPVPVPGELVVAQREAVGDIPVPIVPGTRVTEAEIRPPAPPSPPRPPVGVRRAERPTLGTLLRSSPVAQRGRTIAGRLSASEDRARADARLQLENAVGDWLEPDVPHSWTPPKRLVDALIVGTEVKPVEKEFGTLYEATIRADLTPERRTEIVETYQRELVARRMAILAGILAFILSCLAALAGYIKTDEATKGYYTNRLRALAAAGVGAAGVIIYHIVT